MERRWLDLCHGNRYTTTIHVVNSLIVKSSKLTKATKVRTCHSPPHLMADSWMPYLCRSIAALQTVCCRSSSGSPTNKACEGEWRQAS